MNMASPLPLIARRRRTLFAIFISALIPSLAQAALGTQFIRPSTESQPVFAVVHVDINPADVSKALPVLARFAEQARKDPGMVHFELLQQEGGHNHFTILEVLRSNKAYEAFVSSEYAKAMRAEVQPWLGSPFDERLHHEARP